MDLRQRRWATRATRKRKGEEEEEMDYRRAKRVTHREIFTPNRQRHTHTHTPPNPKHEVKESTHIINMQAYRFVHDTHTKREKNQKQQTQKGHVVENRLRLSPVCRALREFHGGTLTALTVKWGPNHRADKLTSLVQRQRAQESDCQATRCHPGARCCSLARPPRKSLRADGGAEF